MIYGFVTGVRNYLYNSNVLHSVKFNLPVISVGNITVGGTGKTPHTEYLVRLLKENFRVATLSRGYKRKTNDFQIATSSSDVRSIGDEPLQLFRKFPDITVAVDNDRVHGVNEILKAKPETSVIILDDAFQHRKIRPGLSILLADYSRPMTQDIFLPYGNLRENIHNKRRADIVIISKSPEKISPIQKRIRAKEFDKAPYQVLFFTSLKYLDPVPVFAKKTSGNITDQLQWKKLSIVLVTGIANPAPLIKYIHNHFGKEVHLDFADHHQYTNNDILKIRAAWENIKSPLKYIITTEKDAVRLKEFKNIDGPFRSAFYYIPIGIFFLHDEKEKFDKMILDYVRKNK